MGPDKRRQSPPKGALIESAGQDDTAKSSSGHKAEKRRIDWSVVLEQAAGIVSSYDTGVTLRQLHYRLVSMPELGYPNTQTAYKGLSSHTAQARRDGVFPALVDRTRRIEQQSCWDSPRAAIDALVDQYALDRTGGQDVSVFLAVEKAGLIEQLKAWFLPLGVPILALGGYASQKAADDTVEMVNSVDRPAVLIYAGDFDPSGQDIPRDFVARTACWKHVEQVALTPEQVDAYQLAPAPGKATDSRAGAFVERHGRLVQVELDALAPDDLRALYSEAIGRWWDVDAYQGVLDRENEDVSTLRTLARSVER